MTYSTAQIAELFPDLLHIRDAGLRDKVVAVWNEALATGCSGRGWTFDEIRAIPFTLLAGPIDMRFVEHLNSCCRQCIAIARVLGETFGDRVPVNLDHLIAGSLLADVGKMLEFDKDASGKVVKGRFGDLLRHPFSGVALCYKHELPPEVMHIVATHSHEGDKVERTIESWIFHHADFIDFDIAKVLGKRAAAGARP
jgi:putative nucleotidyltransferase with HDIG domain